MIDLVPCRRLLSAAILPALALGLVACGEPAERAHEAAETSLSGPSLVQDDSAKEPATGAEAAPGTNPVRFSSDYTQLSFDDCTITRRAVEGESVDYRCPGRGDVALFLHDGDGRYDVDAGVRNEQFQSIGAFNSLGTTVEWRLDGGEPIAVIFRLYDATDEQRGRSVIGVEKIGTQAPGCRIAQIAGDTPRVNEVARQIADEQAAGFSCGEDDPQFIGNAR